MGHSSGFEQTGQMAGISEPGVKTPFGTNRESSRSAGRQQNRKTLAPGLVARPSAGAQSRCHGIRFAGMLAPFWCSVRLVARPLASVSKVIWASTTLKKKSRSLSGKIWTLGWPVAWAKS